MRDARELWLRDGHWPRDRLRRRLRLGRNARPIAGNEGVDVRDLLLLVEEAHPYRYAQRLRRDVADEGCEVEAQLLEDEAMKSAVVLQVPNKRQVKMKKSPRASIYERRARLNVLTAVGDRQRTKSPATQLDAVEAPSFARMTNSASASASLLALINVILPKPV